MRSSRSPVPLYVVSLSAFHPFRYSTVSRCAIRASLGVDSFNRIVWLPSVVASADLSTLASGSIGPSSHQELGYLILEELLVFL